MEQESFYLSQRSEACQNQLISCPCQKICQNPSMMARVVTCLDSRFLRCLCYPLPDLLSTWHHCQGEQWSTVIRVLADQTRIFRTGGISFRVPEDAPHNPAPFVITTRNCGTKAPPLYLV